MAKVVENTIAVDKSTVSVNETVRIRGVVALDEPVDGQVRVIIYVNGEAVMPLLVTVHGGRGEYGYAMRFYEPGKYVVRSYAEYMGVIDCDYIFKNYGYYSGGDVSATNIKFYPVDGKLRIEFDASIPRGKVCCFDVWYAFGGVWSRWGFTKPVTGGHVVVDIRPAVSPEIVTQVSLKPLCWPPS